ncbi:Trp biosynthesis-associated membrane protein [Nakamurella sp.]|uniref:Trp biosynthesis-associated membrane protein n=1 Tax=Nakamurella sp. TaxID=1869182 RepID=UPI00378381C8
MTESRARRTTAVVAGLVLAGAAGCAGAAAMTWWTAEYVDPLTGPLTLTASGAACLPELVPVALIGLAGFGATLATQGWLRRAVGAILLLGGLLVAVRAGAAMTQAPAVLTGSLVRPADPAGPALLHPAGPLLALAGGVLVALAGALIAAGLGGRRRLGARYDAPTAAAATPMTPAAPANGANAASPAAGTGTAGTGEGAPGSTDVGDWWKALDAGADPTVAHGSDSGGYHDR